MSEVLPDPRVPGAWDSSWDTPVSHSSGSTIHVSSSTKPRPSSSNPQGGAGSSSHSRTRGREDHTPKPPIREVVKRPIAIAVFGQTGTGKSSFIKAVTGQDLKVGHSLTSCTEEVQEFACKIDDECVVLIDTPGFSDTNFSDTEILRRIADWMQDTYEEGYLLSGIIYLHRIIDPRMEGPSLKNLRMMKKLCGEASLRNVVLATTMWENVTIEDGERREKELQENFWKEMLEGGAKIERITTQSGDEAQSLVKTMLKNKPTSTRLQEELHSGLTLVQTGAGMEIKVEMAKLEQRLRAEHKKEMSDLEAAQRDRNEELEKELRKEMETTRRWLEGLEKEKKDLEELTTKRVPKVKRGGFFGLGSYCCRYCGRKTKAVGRWTCRSCKSQQRNVW